MESIIEMQFGHQTDNGLPIFLMKQAKMKFTLEKTAKEKAKSLHLQTKVAIINIDLSGRQIAKKFFGQTEHKI